MSAKKGVTPRRWTAEEDVKLREMYLTHSSSEIAHSIGRTPQQVKNRCWLKGLAFKAFGPWTSDEDDAVRNIYALPNAEAMRVALSNSAPLSGRTVTAVRDRAHKLGLTSRSRPKAAERRPPRRKTANAAELTELKRQIARDTWKRQPHPRGMYGKTHTEQTKAIVGQKSRERWADPNSKENSDEQSQKRSDAMLKRTLTQRPNGYSRCAGGRRSDLGDRYFRSAWEANYARYLNLMVKAGQIASWEFEPQTFVFEAIKRGTRAYTPDFKVVYFDGRHEWHEVKGWMDAASKTRLKRMAKYYPREKVIVIGEAWFRSAVRGGLAGSIPTWEYKGRAPKRAA